MLLALIVVVDGDTVDEDGVRWRLADVDAPEIGRARCDAERQAGILAAARLIQLLKERGGRLEPVDGGKRDKYGRMLGHLYIGGENWSAIAAREGLARRWQGSGVPPSWCER